MTEKLVFEDYVVIWISQLREKDWYPPAVRITTGLYHSALAVLYGGVGIAALLGNNDAILAARRYGMSIINAGNFHSIHLLVAVSIVVALLNALAAYLLFTDKPAGYWYELFFNLAVAAWMLFAVHPYDLVQWAQAAIAFLLFLLWLKDQHLKRY